MTTETFEQMLTGGHPNSLGRALEVVDIILADKNQLEALYQCYFSQDEVVRLRTSNAFKRVTKEHVDWFIPYIDRFLNEISQINQPSTQWTLATLCLWSYQDMSEAQVAQAKTVLKSNLESYTDWIVLNNTMETLAVWAKEDDKLKQWLLPKLEVLKEDDRKSVAKRADKFFNQLSNFQQTT